MSVPQGSACVRCPKLLGKSCCEPRGSEHLAIVTRADMARIHAHTGLAVHRFTHEEGLTEYVAAEYESRWPLYRGYFRRGPVRVTLASRRGACVFLDPAKGCGLPADVRPVACRLYPFEQWADGSWSVAVSRYGDLALAREEGGACLAVEEAGSMEELLVMFGTTREAVEALGASLAEESRAHGRG
ncbi:hypothetical protein [Stigmatella aurantiaca]|uniref:Conserved uncharacterized protein n=1 Tax=Stigmatella aurantiaca (strain DW4/3-1) TaxID=378806 RepID=Q090R2_STIAD|nr:hypothetical protein [Stigmatella aurantiaca]ADO74616.1 conserved uncharacterized protein [Stigmatella aurantiaca DW4/3-1]EAU66202.1 conserved hypothetical protein [Stigmatella aurantiaca DW4/3-1]